MKNYQLGKDTFNELSDVKLLSLVKGGNQLAFGHIYNKYWKRLFAYAYNILNEKELAEDAIHEIFSRIWINKDSIEVANLQNYLFVSMRNKCISLLGNATFTAFDDRIIESLSISPEGESNLHLQDLQSVIEEAAKELPERCKEIFFMSRYQNFSNAEIATHFQISQRTVENQLSLALKHIRHTISKSQSLI